MQVVRLQNGVVKEALPVSSLADAIKYYGNGQENNFTRSCAVVPDEVQQGWIHDPESGEFSPPPEPGPPVESVDVVTARLGALENCMAALLGAPAGSSAEDQLNLARQVGQEMTARSGRGV